VATALLAMVGPTGAGKSALAISLAKTFGGEIVNCDSLQLYRGFDIGTAKTPPEARGGIAHHLIDVLEPGEGFSAGEYARAARSAIAEIGGRGRLPIVAGGSGFYLRALLDGLPPLPGREESLRARLQGREARRPGSLHGLLSRLEPGAAARIHPHDAHKLIRALEVRLLTGAALPAPESGPALAGWRAVMIGLSPPRARLREVLEERARAMFAQGLLEEVRKLLETGCTGAEKPFEALGYRQALAHLRGEMSLEEAVESTVAETRQYAKRQWTWFRRDPRVRWLEGFGGDPAVAAEATALVRGALGGS
jgi:tRNA dimethylallyltransferase